MGDDCDGVVARVRSVCLGCELASSEIAWMQAHSDLNIQDVKPRCASCTFERGNSHWLRVSRDLKALRASPK